MTMMLASAIADRRCRAFWSTVSAATPCASRSSNGVTVKNTAAALLAFVNEAASKPLKLAVCSTPGMARRSLITCCTTALYVPTTIPVAAARQ